MLKVTVMSARAPRAIDVCRLSPASVALYAHHPKNAPRVLLVAVSVTSPCCLDLRANTARRNADSELMLPYGMFVPVPRFVPDAYVAAVDSSSIARIAGENSAIGT